MVWVMLWWQGQRKALTQVEIGLVGAVRQRPVALAAIGGLDHDAEADDQRLAGGQQVGRQRGVKLETIGLGRRTMAAGYWR
jgi:hypothetical protein